MSFFFCSVYNIASTFAKISAWEVSVKSKIFSAAPPGALNPPAFTIVPDLADSSLKKSDLASPAIVPF